MANSFRLKLSVSALTALGIIAAPSTGSATSLPQPALSDPNAIGQALPPLLDASPNIPAIAPPEIASFPEPSPPALIAQALPASQPTWTIEPVASVSQPSWTVESTVAPVSSVAPIVAPPKPAQEITQGTIPQLVAPVPAPSIPVPATPNAAPPSEKTLSEQAAEIEKQLLELEQLEKNTAKSWRKTGYLASPGITIANPTGFGVDKNKPFFGIGVERTRINSFDGGAAVGIGLGNADTAIGVEIAYTASSISPAKLFGNKSAIAASDRPFGSGSFGVKLHRRFPGNWSVALGGNGLINIGPKGASILDPTIQNELQGTYYAVATKLIPLKQDPDANFSLLTFTAGLGSGYFLTDKQYLSQLLDGKFPVNPFGSISLQINRSTSAILEWSGQDLGFGVSFVPFKRLPIVLTPTIRDIIRLPGVANGPRFTIGIGLGF
jgi:hypothetical protein